MEDSDVINRLAIVRKQRWSRDLFYSWCGIDLWTGVSSAAAQFRIWAERFPDGRSFMGASDVDRWMFERFLQQREWVPYYSAAIQCAMSNDDFSKTLNEMANRDYISPSLVDGEVGGMYPSSLLRDLPKRLPSFPRKIFSSHSAHVRAFHQAIKDDLKIDDIKFLRCTASAAFNEDVLDAACDYDIITMEPIGITHRVWLEFGKPIALSPDVCSIITYAKHESVLRDLCMGMPEDSELSMAREFLGLASVVTR